MEEHSRGIRMIVCGEWSVKYQNTFDMKNQKIIFELLVIYKSWSLYWLNNQDSGCSQTCCNCFLGKSWMKTWSQSQGLRQKEQYCLKSRMGDKKRECATRIQKMNTQRFEILKVLKRKSYFKNNNSNRQGLKLCERVELIAWNWKGIVIQSMKYCSMLPLKKGVSMKFCLVL